MMILSYDSIICNYICHTRQLTVFCVECVGAARARGRFGGRPCKMTKETLTMAMDAMSDIKSNASEVAKSLGITTTTLYAYVNGDETPKAMGQSLLDK